jgi:hypothetical protein
MYMDTRNYPTLHLDTNVQEQLVVRKDMDVHGHAKLSNITLRYHVHPYPFLLQAVPLLVSKCNVR